MPWELDREGSEHSLYRLGKLRISIPRHNEINEITAQGILKDTEDDLGEGWWR